MCGIAARVLLNFPENCGATADSRASGTWGFKELVAKAHLCYAATEEASSCR